MAAVQINDRAYVTQDGKLVGNPKAEYMVDSESDLQDIENVAPGTVAYTAGLKSMWQLSASGEWVKM